MNFWQNLQPLKTSSGRMTKKPIMVLAPLADVTDPAFRFIIAKYSKYGGQDIGEYGKFTRPHLGIVGGPDVMWTEFVSADGLFLSPVREYCEKFLNKEISKKELESLSNGIGGSVLIKDLAFTEAERPIVAQFFTARPEMMEKAAELACDLEFDGIDINMGCPDKSVEKQGSGAAHIKNYKQAQEIIRAAQKGAQKDGKNLPVSVKTRIGYNKNELETWLPALLETEPAVITIHARTRKEMSSVSARWEHVARAVEIRNNFKNKDGKPSETLIFGNGDVKNLEDAKEKAGETSCDGIMLGRAIFGNPWLFANLSHAKHGRRIEHPAQILQQENNQNVDKPNDKNIKTSQSRNSAERSECDVTNTPRKIGAGHESSIPERLRVMIEHTKLFEELLPQKNFVTMKKHYKAYVTGWPARNASQRKAGGDGTKELRQKLMETKNAGEVEKIVNDYIKSNTT